MARMPDTLLLLFIAESPQDDVLWNLLAAQYADDDEFEVAKFISRDYDMIRRLLTGTYGDIVGIRNEAKKVGAEAVALIDKLTPLLRRKKTRQLQNVPPLPKR